MVELKAGDVLSNGEYSVIVTATDGYNTETRKVNFTVADGFEVKQAYMLNSDGEVIKTLENKADVKAIVEVETALDFEKDFDIIAIMRASNGSIADVQYKGKAELENNTATFDFTVPENGTYTLEYLIWESVGSLKPITEKGDFVSLKSPS